MPNLKAVTYDLLDSLEDQAKFRLITRIFDESRPMTRGVLVRARDNAVCFMGAAIPEHCQHEWTNRGRLTAGKLRQLFKTRYYSANYTEGLVELAWDTVAEQIGPKKARRRVQGYILRYIKDQGGI